MTRFHHAGLLLLALLTFSAGALSAQEAMIRGRIVDAESRPLAGQLVVLHRVAEATGSEVGRSMTDDGGRFEIRYDPTQGEGVYFGATRFEGGLFVGAPFRSADQVGPDYLIVVGENAVDFTAGVPAPGASTDPTTWILAGLIGLIGAALVALPLMKARQEPYATRGLLIELARIEDLIAAGGKGGEVEEARTRRGRIRSRLRGTPATPVRDAAGQH